MTTPSSLSHHKISQIWLHRCYRKDVEAITIVVVTPLLMVLCQDTFSIYIERYLPIVFGFDYLYEYCTFVLFPQRVDGHKTLLARIYSSSPNRKRGMCQITQLNGKDYLLDNNTIGSKPHKKRIVTSQQLVDVV